MTEKYTEILRLKKMLEDENIPFKFGRDKYLNGYHLYSNDFTVNTFNLGWSVIEHDGSYGRKQNLLEVSSGLMTKEEIQKEHDNVLGWLTAEDVFRRIVDFEKRNKNDN